MRGEFDLGLKSMQSSTLRGLLGWGHGYGDTTLHTRHNFRGGQPFTIWGAPLARNAALVEMGLDMAPTKLLEYVWAIRACWLRMATTTDFMRV